MHQNPQELRSLKRATSTHLDIYNGASSSPAGLNTSGGVIAANPNKTTTVLGRWTDDMKSIIGDKTDNAISQLEPGSYLPKTTDFGTKPGGFNVLNVPKDVEIAAEGRFFETVNKPFLDAAIKRGDDVALATIPRYKSDYITADGSFKGNYAKELDYLVKNNYKPVNVSLAQWNTIKGWFK